jgi:hypothetical protein
MIFWKGWGILALLIGAAGFFGGILLGDALFRRTQNVQVTYLVGAAALLVAATVNWFAGRALNRTRREAGASAFNRHSLFWIPMEWWSVPMLIMAVVALIAIPR